MKQEPFIHKIDNEQTAQLPAIEFRGKICIVDREEQVEEACRHLAAQSVIGFDTETRPSFKAGVSYRVSLLQLSSEERCYLFRLNKIARSKPILKLLENPALKKIGADVAGDLRALHQLRHFARVASSTCKQSLPSGASRRRASASSRPSYLVSASRRHNA